MALVLASASAIRQAMLTSAGVAVERDPAKIDEDAFKSALDRPEEIAPALAQAKALAVSSRRAGDWVIGSDSIASVEGHTFNKPRSRSEAAEHLRFFSGKSLQLTSAVALARNGEVSWTHQDSAVLAVRTLSDDFIESYLDEEWPEVGYCVGVFRLEGRGVQLFERIEGDHFTILGMPLLALLTALRERELLAS